MDDKQRFLEAYRNTAKKIYQKGVHYGMTADDMITKLTASTLPVEFTIDEIQSVLNILEPEPIIE